MRRKPTMHISCVLDLPVSKKRHDSVFVVVDRLSKVVHVQAITKTITAQGLAAVYAHRVFRWRTTEHDTEHSIEL